MAKKVKLATILRAGRASLAGSGTAGTGPVGDRPPIQVQNVPNFSLPQGSSRLLTPYFEDPDGDPIYYQEASTPTNTSKLSITPGGNIVAAADCPLGTYQIKVQFSDVAFPPAPGEPIWVADVPELWFILGYPETEELGIYICDPTNRTERGDLWWQTGARLQRVASQGGGNWTAQRPVTLTPTSGSLQTGVTFDAATARLQYNGAGTASADCTVNLACGGQTKQFRIRVLKPTVICTSNIAGMPAVLSSVTTVAPSGTAWATLKTSGASGATDAAPRVILFDNQVIPRNDWFIGDASVTADYRYMYIAGVPGGSTQLGGAYSPAAGTSFNLFACTRFRSWHFKNLRMSNCGVVTGIQESGFPTRWTMQKIDWLERNPVTNMSNVENGSDWEPNAYPTQVNDFRFHCVNSKMIQGGSTTSIKHCFYIETNGYTFVDHNNLHLLGANKSSIIKGVVGFLRVRNCYIAHCATPNDPYASTYWSQENIDPHSHVETVIYNNEVIGASDSGHGAGGTGNQNGKLAFLQCRRPNRGSNTPNYPSTSWSNPGVTGGPESPRLGTFPLGAATFKNPAFWAAVVAGGLADGSNPYLFRHFLSFNTVRLAPGTPGRGKAMRIDGTHPSEVEVQLATETYQLGCPAEWVERCTLFTANNTFVDWNVADEIYSITDSPNIVLVEDGTKMVSRTVTLDNSQTGKVRIRLSNGRVMDADGSIKTRINWQGVSPPPAFDTFAELQTVLLTPSSWTEDPVKWPPAKWPPTAMSQGPHPELADNEPYSPRIVDLGGQTYKNQVNAIISLPSWFQL